jgi:formate dehydrogenase major subunit
VRHRPREIGSAARARRALAPPSTRRVLPLAVAPMHRPETTPALEMNVKDRSRRGMPAGAYTRLTQPLVRVNGALRPATWDDALDRAAEGFRRNLRDTGRTATGIFSCSKSTNEVNYLASKLARQVFGNNNVDSCNRT